MEVIELKVRLHCKACEKSVRRTLYKLKGVTCVEIDVRSSKITVLGYTDHHTIIKAIRKTGRRASEWSYHRYGFSNGNLNSAYGHSSCKTGRRVPVSTAIQACNKETKVPAMEKFSRRKTYISRKILMAMCLKGKQSNSGQQIMLLKRIQ